MATFNPFILASILSQGAQGYQAGVASAQERQDRLNQDRQTQANWSAQHALAAQAQADQESQFGQSLAANKENLQSGYANDVNMAGINHGYRTDEMGTQFGQSIGLQNNQAGINTAADDRAFAQNRFLKGVDIASGESAYQEGLGRVPSSPQQKQSLDTRNWILGAMLGPTAPRELSLKPGTMAPLDLQGQATAESIRSSRSADARANNEFGYKRFSDAQDRNLEQQKLTENRRQFGDQMALGWAKQNMEYKKTVAEIAALKAKGAVDPGAVQHFSGLASNYGTQASALSKAADAMEQQAQQWGAKAQGMGTKPDDDGNVTVPPGEAMIYQRYADNSHRRAQELRAQAQAAAEKQDQLVGLLTGGKAGAKSVPAAPAPVTTPWTKVGKTPVSYRVISPAGAR
jgi:hypothetical protein